MLKKLVTHKWLTEIIALTTLLFIMIIPLNIDTPYIYFFKLSANDIFSGVYVLFVKYYEIK